MNASKRISQLRNGELFENTRDTSQGFKKRKTKGGGSTFPCYDEIKFWKRLFVLSHRNIQTRTCSYKLLKFIVLLKTLHAGDAAALFPGCQSNTEANTSASLSQAAQKVLLGKWAVLTSLLTIKASFQVLFHLSPFLPWRGGLGLRRALHFTKITAWLPMLVLLLLLRWGSSGKEPGRLPGIDIKQPRFASLLTHQEIRWDLDCSLETGREHVQARIWEQWVSDKEKQGKKRKVFLKIWKAWFLLLSDLYSH